jgi:hypothetical protein
VKKGEIPSGQTHLDFFPDMIETEEKNHRAHGGHRDRRREEKFFSFDFFDFRLHGQAATRRVATSRG